MSKNTVEFYKAGTKVSLADEVYGIIVCVRIGTNNNISYDCGWWHNGIYYKETFTPNEIEPVSDTDKTKIGFV